MNAKYNIRFKDSLSNLSPQAEENLNAVFQRNEFPKGHLLFRQGEVCRHIFYIEKGLARIFYNFRVRKSATTR